MAQSIIWFSKRHLQFYYKWRQTFDIVTDNSFHLIHSLLHSRLLWSIHFSSLFNVCLKNETSRQKYGFWFFIFKPQMKIIYPTEAKYFDLDKFMTLSIFYVIWCELFLDNAGIWSELTHLSNIVLSDVFIEKYRRKVLIIYHSLSP